jgi:3-oxoacyl-[acyl-carrier protein] reductase
VRLSGKVALVTGAASGLGAATARLFAREGAVVVLLDRDGDTLAAVAKDCPEHMVVVADVRSSAAVDQAFAATVAEVGPPDVVVHAAGIDDVKVKLDIAADVDPSSILTSLTDAQWREQIDVNLSGTFFVLRAALREMVARESGSFVSISSSSGITGGPWPHYGAAKAGVLGLIRSAATQVWAKNVRVNAIAPGEIDTPMLRRNPAIEPSALERRFGRPSEIASVALFLATDESSYMTGETVIVAGPVLTI